MMTKLNILTLRPRTLDSRPCRLAPRLRIPGPRTRVPGSFTVEGAYIFAILFFTLAFLFQYAFRERDRVLTGMALSEAAAATARLEPLYDPGGTTPEQISAALTDRLSALAASPDVTAVRSRSKAESSADSALGAEVLPPKVVRTINSPESLMRLTTALDRFRTGKSAKEGRKIEIDEGGGTP